MTASIISSVVTGGSNNHSTISEEANAYATDFVSQGVVGAVGNTSGAGPATGGFGLSQDASPDMGVLVNLGVAYVLGTPSGQGSQVMRARMTTNYTTYVINANASGSTKYDWIYLQLSATNAATPSAAADNVITLLTSRSTSNVSDNGTPPTYGLLLGVVTVTNGASSIVNANISDRRVQSAISNSTITSTTGWQSLNAALTYSTNNGDKSFNVTAPSDLTSTLSAGMKLRIPRGVTPPTQAMAFVSASSQYATKASPTGVTFTSAFTCESWIYLLSYPSSTGAGVIGRTDNSTGGAYLYVNQTGQVVVQYGASSSFTNFASNQILQLNQWYHIAGVVSSVSSKTGLVYINGAAVTMFSGITSATTLAQTSNLSIGAFGAGVASSFLNGYISEARIWSVAQSAASIQANMAINLVGNETNLVALYQANGVFSDATSNANNLTATNGAIATQVINPYNANEYATVIAISYSNPTTTLTLFTPINYSIPNSTLGTVAYSTAQEPFAWPNIDLQKVSVYDSTLVPLVLKYVTNTPVDSIGFSNTGTAGGTMYFSQIGKEKRLWGLSAATLVNTSSGPNFTWTLPTGFFTTIQMPTTNWTQIATTANQSAYVNTYSVTTIQSTTWSASTTAASQQLSLFAIGS